MRFDLLIRGGEVVDPGGGKEGRLDVAIERDRIAAVDKDISPESAFHVVDAGGQIVTPGLVDLHTHVFHKITYWGIDPDPVASRTGVTTWNDAGSAGALTLPGLRDFVVRPAQVESRPSSISRASVSSATTTSAPIPTTSMWSCSAGSPTATETSCSA